MILSRNRTIKKKRLFVIMWDRPFFTKSTRIRGVPNVLPGLLVDPYRPEGGLLEDIEFV